MAARPNYRQTIVVPVAPEHNVPEAMNIEANPPPPQSFWQNHFVKTFIAMLVLAAGYSLVRLGYLIAEKTQHHHHTLCSGTTTVSLDGTGEYTTLSGALKNVPDKSTAKFCVLIKPGRYTENLVVGFMKTNVVFIGEGADKTILTAEKNTTLEVLGRGFMAQNLTIENPSLALNVSSDQAVIYNCQITSNSSALHVHKGRQFYRDCKIHGAYSIISGPAAAYFQSCNVSVGQNPQRTSSVLTSHGGQHSWQETGFIFDYCRIESAPGSMSPSIYVGCPGGDHSLVVVMRSVISGAINPKGWTICDGYVPSTYYFGEYNNTGPGADTKSRIKWKEFKVLTDAEAAQFGLHLFFSGNIEWISNYGVPYLL